VRCLLWRDRAIRGGAPDRELLRRFPRGERVAWPRSAPLDHFKERIEGRPGKPATLMAMVRRAFIAPWSAGAGSPQGCRAPVIGGERAGSQFRQGADLHHPGHDKTTTRPSRKPPTHDAGSELHDLFPGDSTSTSCRQRTGRALSRHGQVLGFSWRAGKRGGLTENPDGKKSSPMQRSARAFSPIPAAAPPANVSSWCWKEQNIRSEDRRLSARFRQR